uniref:Uncharacterized protein LOC104246357 n=1 Tax=Nicotiana sylvestris TaxID=4096 RepID=A0A1U7YMK4_NICSY|nr:PREDICTED: uncharacterized protein LOC104246357 [Nicotiana sylvestris]
MVGQLPRVEWKVFMFGDDTRAKAKFTMWLYFQDRMMTSDRLARWGMHVDTKCVLCQSCDESRNHMFVECEFARSIWKRLLKWMQRQTFWATSWDQHWKWAIENAKEKSSSAAVFKMIYAEAIHTIWNERNLRVFEKQSSSFWPVNDRKIILKALKIPALQQSKRRKRQCPAEVQNIEEHCPYLGGDVTV